MIDRYGIDTVVLTPIWKLDQALFPYFRGRYGVTRQLDQAVLIRVRDPASPDGPLLP